MINEQTEFHVVKRFVTVGPIKNCINIPFFPIGFASLWEQNRDEAKIGKSLKEIDLLSIQTNNSSSNNFSEYKTLFQFLCYAKTLCKPIGSFNFQKWKAWQKKLKNTRVWIFEAKSAKGNIVKALGQILMYKELFRKDYPLSEIVGCGIVYEAPTEVDLQLREVCKSFDIKIFRV